MNAFRDSASALGLTARVIACDLAPEGSAACALADAAFAVPRATDAGYVDAVLDIATREGCRLVVPTIDPELLPLAQAKARFAEAGIAVHVSEVDAIAIARDKAATSEALRAAGVPVPETYAEADVLAGAAHIGWPIFAKPAAGSASRGLATYAARTDLPAAFEEPMVFQQKLVGAEFTVNCYVDEDGRLQTVIPHRRLSVRAGEVERGTTERRADARDFAERIVAALPGLRGVFCFQFIDDATAGPRVFEINARFGGGYPLAHFAGAEFTRWLLEQVHDLPRSAHDDWQEGATMRRFDDAVFTLDP